jgi:hypothetical protein
MLAAAAWNATMVRNPVKAAWMNTGWRNMLWALLAVREGTRIALLLAGLSIVLGLTVDHSDRGLPWLLFLLGQGLLAIVHVVAAFWMWWTLEDSLTRRRGRLTCVIVGAVVSAVILFLGIVPQVLHRLQVGFATTLNFLAIAAFSFLVALASIGIAWLQVHEAIGRDCGDLQVIAAARRLAVAWSGFWAVAVTLLFRNAFRPFSYLDDYLWLSVLAVLILLNLLYLRLVRASSRAIRAACSQ